jgi:hypothetical protein
LACILGCIGAAIADASAAEKLGVQVVALENKAALGAAEMTFLSQAVLSVFTVLPAERFAVQSAPVQEGCDEACAVAAPAQTDRLVWGTVMPFGNGYAIVLKLYDAESKALLLSETTEPQESMEALLKAAKRAAAVLRDFIEPLPKAAPPPASAAPAAPPPKQPSSISGKIVVRTEPPGAEVYISRDDESLGELTGKTPVEKALLPLTYWVSIHRPGYVPVDAQEVRIDPGETESLDLKLTFDYPPNPYKTFGHVAFWTGVALLSVGIAGTVMALNYADNYHYDGYEEYRTRARQWTGAMWAGFIGSAALMGSGIVLWILSPGDKRYYEKKHGIKSAKFPVNGFSPFSYVRRF